MSEDKEYEERLQRRLGILKNELENGQIHFPIDSELPKLLQAMRLTPNGSFDLSTVPGQVRAMALASEHMHDRREAKNAIPLRDIQLEYFNFIDKNFSHFYKQMIKAKADPHDFAAFLAKDNDFAEEIATNIPVFLEAIEEFWTSAYFSAFCHVEDMHDTLKGVYGGDLFPVCTENIASKCGFYIDTIILPDPFLRSKLVFEKSDNNYKCYMLFKHGLNILQYKEFACADITPPIIAILPDTTQLFKENLDSVAKLGMNDALVHFGNIFGSKFHSLQELIDFALQIDSMEKLEKSIANKDRILFDTAWGGDYKTQIQTALKSYENQTLQKHSTPGLLIADAALGRMGISNELLLKSMRFRGTPIIDAETSWKYFVWKLEYDAKRYGDKTGMYDLHIAKGLQSLPDNEMQWLGNIPAKALIEMRKTGAIDEMRIIIGKGVFDIINETPLNFKHTSEKIITNIQSSFSLHQENVKKLTAKKWRFAGVDLLSCLTTGSLAIAAAVANEALLGVAAVMADQILPGTKIKDLPKTAKEIHEESKAIKQSPVGIMFKYKDK